MWDPSVDLCPDAEEAIVSEPIREVGYSGRREWKIEGADNGQIDG